MSNPNLVTRWSEEYQRYYTLIYVNDQWVFWKWLDSRDAVCHRNTTPREGTSIVGTYSHSNPQHYEALEPSFFVRPSSFFQEGKVFAVLFTEPAGQSSTDYNTSISYVRFNDRVYSQIRRFIVVRQRREFCFAIPIFTYGNQGTLKPGVSPSEHAIAYSWGSQSRPLPGESQLQKTPICIVMNAGESHLSQASRIYFGVHHPIQYNVKVKDLGYVLPSDIPRLLGYWNMENSGPGFQAPEVSTDSVEA